MTFLGMRTCNKARADIQQTRGKGFSPEFFIKANKELAAKAPPTIANGWYRHVAVNIDKARHEDHKQALSARVAGGRWSVIPRR